MAETACNGFRSVIVDHFTGPRVPLSAEAKAHLGECQACIEEVTRILALAANSTPGSNGAAIKELPREGQLALQHGREVLRREFGIAFGGEAKARS